MGCAPLLCPWPCVLGAESVLRAARSSAGRQPLCPSWSSPGKPRPYEPPNDDSHQHRPCLCSAVPSPFLLGERGESSRVQAKAFLSPPPTAGAKKPYSFPPECNTAFLLPPPHHGEGPRTEPGLPASSPTWGGLGLSQQRVAHRIPFHRVVHGQCSPSP